MTILDGSTFAAMANNGYKNIKLHYEKINDLNVFPVPDGDTGTNMTSTIRGGMAALEECQEPELGAKAKALAHGMLFGARGNSGVILSQFFAGLADGLEDKETADIPAFIAALESGVAKAYKAVKTPVEGTILTVARKAAEAAKKEGTFKDFEDIFQFLAAKMNEALAETPNELAVLKEAGVVDSGGAGLVTIISGMGKQLSGEELEDTPFAGPTSYISVDKPIPFDADSVLEYGYCTEFILQLQNAKQGLQKFDLDAFIAFLETLGDSIVALRDKGIVKVHVHTKTPGLVINEAQKYGEFVTFKMENMSIQHQEKLLKEMPIKAKEKVDHAIVCVAPSEEFASLFKDMGADYIIMGGQTMNPSAEDFVKAFEEVNAKQILVFPNNGNVILTAEQAANLISNTQIAVLPSKSPVQAYSALKMLDFDGMTFEENIQTANESIENVAVVDVSIAIRDTTQYGIEVHTGDYIVIGEHRILGDDPDLTQALVKAAAKLPGFEDKSVLTLFYGQGVTEEQKQSIRDYVDSTYPLMDLVEMETSQIVYPLIVAVE